MYGKYVEYAGTKVWVWCCPNDSEETIWKLAQKAYEKCFLTKTNPC
jgi:hypothetical protein